MSSAPCPRCGGQHPDTAKFCPQTGKVIPPPAPSLAKEEPAPAVIPAEAAPHERACRNCGRTIAAAARFCPYCAAGQDDMPSPPTGQPTRSPLLSVGIAIVLLVVLGALAFIAGWRWMQQRELPAAPPASGTPPVSAVSETPSAASPTPLPSPTPPPLPTATPTATPRPLPTPANAFLYNPSPDGKWLPFEVDGGFILQGSHNAAEWRLLDQNFIDYGYLLIERWSQDGRWMYFSVHKYIDGGWALPVFGLHRLDLTTGQTEPVLTDFAFIFELSPDESAIAYIKSGDDPLTVYVRPRQSNRGEQAYTIRSRYPSLGSIAWSPDQKQLALTAGGGAPGEGFYSVLILLDLEDGSQRDLVNVPRGILIVDEWTPDGFLKLRNSGTEFGWLQLSSGEVTPSKPSAPTGSSAAPPAPALPWSGWLAYAYGVEKDREIYLYNPETGEQRRLTENEVWDEAPSFSPDNSQIVFASYRNEGGWELYLLDTATGSERRLTDFNGQARFPKWSPAPGDQRIVFEGREGEGSSLRLNLWMVDALSGEMVKLTDKDVDTRPRWLPGKETILFERAVQDSDRNGRITANDNADIFLLDLSTGQISPLIETPTHNDVQYACSPDGEWVAYVSAREDEDGDGRVNLNDARGLYLLAADGAQHDYLPMERRHVNTPDWAQSGDKIVFLSRLSDNRHEIWSYDIATQAQRRLLGPGPYFQPEWAR